MTRPLRIEYEGAWYHVMNRGANRQTVFATERDRLAFLALLGEVSEMFAVEVHVFCLMGNHYHLLLHTPRGNLGGAMRHLNGVYTQRHNRAAGRDGPLFRGRYKAILLDADAWLLQVSRYVHRNPLEARLVTAARPLSMVELPSLHRRDAGAGLVMHGDDPRPLRQAPARVPIPAICRRGR